MAIKTGDIFNSLTFGGINSADYGIYITGEAVYNAPERAVELVSVPGRNGAIAIDQGRWENIVVSYSAGMFDTNQSKFASSIAKFRGDLLSKTGYQRLTDTYNPNEFRMGMFVDGIEVSPVQSKAGEFTISFNCKPQRWLTSGENVWTSTLLMDGIDNWLTRFDASPLLMVKGYGYISINNKSITIDSGQTGNIYLDDGVTTGDETTTSLSVTLDYSGLSSAVNAGDVGRVRLHTVPELHGKYDSNNHSYYSVASIDGVAYGWAITAYVTYDTINFTAFPSSNETTTFTDTYAIVLSNGVSFNLTVTRTIVNTTSGTIIMTVQISTSSDVSAYVSHYITKIDYDNGRIYSTVSGLGNPTYIDLDLGEAYKIVNGEVISLNNLVKLPTVLPVLTYGANWINRESTINELKMIPRWWTL